MLGFSPLNHFDLSFSSTSSSFSQRLFRMQSPSTFCFKTLLCRLFRSQLVSAVHCCLKPSSLSINLNQKGIPSCNPPSSQIFPVNFIHQEEEVVLFFYEEISNDAMEHDLSLVSNAICKRPYYEVLLKLVQKVQKIKSYITILSLS